MTELSAKLLNPDFLIQVGQKQVQIKFFSCSKKLKLSVTNNEIDAEFQKLCLRDATFAEGEVWENRYHSSYLGRAIAVRGPREEGRRGRRCMILTAFGCSQDEAGYWEPVVKYEEGIEVWQEPWTGPYLFLVVANEEL